MRNLHSANVQEILAYNDVCAICFSSLEKDARFTRCTHLFHTSCLRKWMEYQDTCPVCKTVVHSDEEDLVGLFKIEPELPSRTILKLFSSRTN